MNEANGSAITELPPADGGPIPALSPDSVRGVQHAVPRALQISAALGWRLLVVVAALYVIGTAVAFLASIVVPVAIALLPAALLAPAVGHLVKHRVPRGVATALVLVGGLAGLGGILTFVVITFVNGLPALQLQLAASIDAIVA